MGVGGEGGGLSAAMARNAHVISECCIARFLDKKGGDAGGQKRGLLATICPLSVGNKDFSKEQRRNRHLQAMAEVKAAQKSAL